MDNKKLYYCNACSAYFGIATDILSCPTCKRSVPIKHGIPLFSKDIYWGKVPETELIKAIELIDKKGFGAFDVKLQKKFDFTYDDDRADWRFYIPLSQNSVALDIGAGLGRISIPLARVCGQVIACDQSVTRMQFLKKRSQAENLNNIETLVGDIYDLPLKGGSVDLIVMNGVLEWVGLTSLYADPRVAQIRALEICKKLLKKGGRLYIGIENRYALAYTRAPDHGGLLYTSYMPRFLANAYSKFRGKGQYRTYTYSRSGYKKLLIEAGFSKKNDFYLLYPGYNLPRVVIPYDDMDAFAYAINAFKRPKGVLGRVMLFFSKSRILLRVYRYFFFSYGIISQA